MRLPQGPRWRSGGPVSWLWRVTRAETTSSTFRHWMRFSWCFPSSLQTKWEACCLILKSSVDCWRKMAPLPNITATCLERVWSAVCEVLPGVAQSLNSYWDMDWCLAPHAMPTAEFFYAGASGDRADCWRRPYIRCIPNQEAAAVCVFYCFISTFKSAPIISVLWCLFVFEVHLCISDNVSCVLRW